MRRRPRNPGGIEVLGIELAPLTAHGLEGRVSALARDDRGGASLVLNVNAHSLNIASCDDGLKRSLLSADLVFADGFGVVLAARMAGGYLPERITYADWIWNLADLAAHEGLSVYLLGGEPGVAARAAGRLTEFRPGMTVSGVHHGYFDRTAGSPENRRVLDDINASGTDILLVGMGTPVQEKWLHDNRKDLEVGVALNCGAAFDYASGTLRRGPKPLTDNGFEWLARLVVEPRRLWRRYLLGNPAFLVRATAFAVRKRLFSDRRPEGTSCHEDRRHTP